jgi:hypothetical protein
MQLLDLAGFGGGHVDLHPFHLAALGLNLTACATERH